MKTNHPKAQLLILVTLMVLASKAGGIEYLTINGEDVDSIDLALGQSCTIEVVSDAAMSYISKLDPMNFGCYLSVRRFLRRMIWYLEGFSFTSSRTCVVLIAFLFGCLWRYF